MKLPGLEKDIRRMIGDADGNIAHQLHKQIVCIGDIPDLDLQKRPNVTVKRRFPELIRVHFAQTFVTLDLRDALLPGGHDRVEQLAGSGDDGLVGAPRESGGTCENLAQ